MQHVQLYYCQVVIVSLCYCLLFISDFCHVKTASKCRFFISVGFCIQSWCLRTADGVAVFLGFVAWQQNPNVAGDKESFCSREMWGRFQVLRLKRLFIFLLFFFRFKHVGVRANAEPIAFYRAGNTELQKTEQYFSNLIASQERLAWSEFLLQS